MLAGHGRWASGLVAAITFFFAGEHAGDAAIVRSTNFGIGADAEVRDWQPTSNFGTAAELAVRIINVDTNPTGGTNDRNDLMYIKIDLSGLTLGNVPGAIFRLSYGKDNQLTQGRVATSSGMQTGLVVYGLNPSDTGNNWGETTITYATAPGITNDNEPGNKDFDLTKSSLLGNILFPTIVPQNWFPAGGPMDLSGPALEAFLTSAISSGAPSVTFIAGLLHDGNPTISGSAVTNRTYLFAHKGTTVINDPNYDSDTLNPSNPLGSPWHNQSNATGDFSPRLVLQEAVVPEPASVVVGLLAMGALLVAKKR